MSNVSLPPLPRLPYPIKSFTVPDPVKIPEIVTTGETPETIENMTNLVFQKIGGHEIINTTRTQNVNGQNIRYQPIKNISEIARDYNPKNIVPLPNSSEFYFNGFAIELLEKIPSKGLGFSRTNLFPNPSIETNTTGYSAFATSGSVSRVTDLSYSGKASLRYAVSSNQTYAGGTLLFGSNTTTSNIAKVLPNTLYSGSAYVYTNKDRYIRAAINFRNSAGTTLNDFASADIFIPANKWTRISYMTTSPATAAFGGVRVHQGFSGDRSYVAGQDFIWMDSVFLEEVNADLINDSLNIYIANGLDNSGIEVIPKQLIIEVVNMRAGEQVQVEIIKSANVFDDTIY